jgi:ABC-type sulfate transport system permease component
MSTSTKTLKPRRPFVEKSVLPGFGLSMGYTVFYLSLLVLIPLSLLFFKSATLGWDHFWTAVSAPRAVASYKLTLGASLIASLVNAVFWRCGRVGSGALQISRARPGGCDC